MKCGGFKFCCSQVEKYICGRFLGGAVQHPFLSCHILTPARIMKSCCSQIVKIWFVTRHTLFSCHILTTACTLCCGCLQVMLWQLASPRKHCSVQALPDNIQGSRRNMVRQAWFAVQMPLGRLRSSIAFTAFTRSMKLQKSWQLGEWQNSCTWSCSFASEQDACASAVQ